MQKMHGKCTMFIRGQTPHARQPTDLFFVLLDIDSDIIIHKKRGCLLRQPLHILNLARLILHFIIRFQSFRIFVIIIDILNDFLNVIRNGHQI